MVCLLIVPSLRGDEATESKNPLPAKPQSLITISKETTYLTEPLTKDGYVNYLKALNQRMSEGVTPENNAAVLFWKAFGSKPVEESVRHEFFDMLGIPAPSEQGDYFITLYDFVNKRSVDKDNQVDGRDTDPLDAAREEQDRAMEKPWNAGQCPLIADWLKANEKPLRLIVEGTRRPRYYRPMVGHDDPPIIVTEWAMLRHGFGAYRGAARALTARAMLKLGSGKVDAAWQDLLACHRMARLIGQGPMLFDALVAIGIDDTTCRADQSLVYHARPNAEQAAAMCASLQSLPPLLNIAEKIDQGERFMGLDAATHVARDGITWLENLAGGGSGGETSRQRDIVEAVAHQIVVEAIAQRKIDWNAILRRMNRWYDRIAAAMSEPDHPERQAALNRFGRELGELARQADDPRHLARVLLLGPSLSTALSRHVGDIMIAVLVPDLQYTVTAEGRVKMTADLTVVSLALAGYHADNGEYPDGLAALAPKYIPEVPKDVFTGAPLHYRREGKGYLLYSVGPNQEDNRGHTWADALDSDSDDIAVRVPPRQDD